MLKIKKFNLIFVYLALKIQIIFKFIFSNLNELESLIMNKKSKKKNIKKIFICSMPRSGTTILAQTIKDAKKFSSFTYKIMPFITIPLIWSKIKDIFFKNQKHERAHKDGLIIDDNSIDALDEFIWSLYTEDYKFNYNNTETINKNFPKIYNNYINKLVNFENNDYFISKSNNNIFRIEYLINNFSELMILVPIREPISHIISIVNTKKIFDLQADEYYFFKDIICMLGHFEFYDMENYNFDRNTYDNDINFSLSVFNQLLFNWCSIYENIIKIHKKNENKIFFLNVDRINENSDELKKLLKNFLNENDLNLDTNIMRASKDYTLDLDLNYEYLKKSTKIYDELKQKCIS